MNNTVKSFATVGAIFAFTGFTTSPNVPNELDRSFFVRREFLARREALTPIECWSKFLQNLQKLDAVIYFPEDKAKLSERFGFHFSPMEWEKRKNEEVILNFNNLVSVEPNGEAPGDGSCAKQTLTTFRQLGMIALVQKSRLAGLEGMDIKRSDFTLKIDDYDHKGNALLKQKVSNDSLLVKLDNGQKIGDNGIKGEFAQKVDYYMKFQGPQTGIIAILIGLHKFVPASSFTFQK